MSGEYYDTQIEDQVRRIHIAQASRAMGDPPPVLVEASRSSRPARRLALDCFLFFLLLLLVPAYKHSVQAFTIIAAMAASLLLGGYWRLIWRVLDWLGPPDQPHIISIIQVPAEIHCPKCGANRPDGKYCPTCGTDVEEAYRRMVRQIAGYAIQETSGICRTLEAAVQERLQQISDEQARLAHEKLAQIEHSFLDEIVRQRRVIHALERRLVESEKTAMERRVPLLAGRFNNDPRCG